MNSKQLSDFYYTTLGQHGPEFLNTVESIDLHRNVAHVLRQNPGCNIGQDSSALEQGRPAVEIAEYLERRAERLEKYGE